VATTTRLPVGRWHRPLKRLLRFLLGLIIRLEIQDAERLPAEGPVIVYFNHSCWLDPLVAAAMLDRDNTIMSKVELLRIPVVGTVLRAYGAFPVRRQEGDLRAFRTALTALNGGLALILAPEGTRNHDGVLQQGKPGMVSLALRADAWLQPVSILGVLDFGRYFRRLRRTPVQVWFGEPFRFRRGPSKLSHEESQALIDEAMYRLAALMPPALRGVYGDIEEEAAYSAAYRTAEL
jgi:1-acyl-sn-glycerol-3-phosphate acyltransferase